ncbi:hypothetical protein BGW42_000817, partial [Actinomortierella wolfii]
HSASVGDPASAVEGAATLAPGATSSTESAEEKKEDDQPRYAPRDSTNYKVPVPPSPATSPRAGPVSRPPPNSFGFLASDPSASNNLRQKAGPPPHLNTGSYDPAAGAATSVMSPTPQHHPHPQYSHSRQGSQSMTSPIHSPIGRRHPYHPWETVLPPTGYGQDQHNDGDREDEGNNTDGDVLSGGEDQRRRHPGYRRAPRPDGAGYPQQYDPQAPLAPPPSNDGEGSGAFTPTRSAPQPPNQQGSIPNNRQTEIEHMLYIQQQQALFMQERALNPPLHKKSSNGNLSSGNEAKSKRNSRHRKKISVISDPKLVSTTNQVRTVPIVRPADDSDGDDAGFKSEYTSGGEGIKRTVRKMKKAVRQVLPQQQQHQSGDESDGAAGPGSKSDAEHRKSGGLKQLKALKSKLAKKLHRPSHSISGAREMGGDPLHQHHLEQHYHHHGQQPHQQSGEGSQHHPVQFFSEENLRSRYLAQAGADGASQSFAEAGASLRRSNTTREGSVRRYGASGDKEEYYSDEEDKDEDNKKEKKDEQKQQDQDASQASEGKDTAETTKSRAAKFASRTFDKDEMIEFRDDSGDTFFVPKWDQDPRADEARSVVSVVTSSSRKLERSTSNATVTSTTTTIRSGASPPTSRQLDSIAERLQSATGKGEEEEEEEETKDKKEQENKDTSNVASPTSPAPPTSSNVSAQAATVLAKIGSLVPEDGNDSDAERHRMAKQIEREIFDEEAESQRQKDQGNQEKQEQSTKAGEAVNAQDVSSPQDMALQPYIPPPPTSTSSANGAAKMPLSVETNIKVEVPDVTTTTTTTTNALTTTATSSASSHTTSPRTSVGTPANDPRASIMSDSSSSNVSSIGGVVNAHVLTRQLSQQQLAPVGLGISFTPASPIQASPNKIPTQELDIHGRLDAVLAQMGLSEKSLPALPNEAEGSDAEDDSTEDAASRPPPPLKVTMPVRPLSPIRRANSTSPKSPLEFFRSASMGGLASLLTGASAAAAATSKDKVNAPLPVPPTELTSSRSSYSSTSPSSARSSSQSIAMHAANVAQIDFSSAPTAPLPTPVGAPSSTATATATATTTATTSTASPASTNTIPSPLPAVIARQSSIMAERQSVKSMYADSIYDYYAYDSASEHESVTGDAAGAHRMSVVSIVYPDQQPQQPQPQQQQQQQQQQSTAEEQASKQVASVAAANLVANVITDSPRSSIHSTASSLALPPQPYLQASSPETDKGEEQHVHFEELPRAVPFRMSMMTTVAVDESNPLIQQQQPARPPRHPMRQSRSSFSSSISTSSYGTVTTTTTTTTNQQHRLSLQSSVSGAVGEREGNPRASMLSMLSSVASSSDLTASDSWVSKRQTRDLSQWDEEDEESEQQQQQQRELEQPQVVPSEAFSQQQQQQAQLFENTEASLAAHLVVEADIKPRHPLSICGPSSQPQSDHEMDLAHGEAPQPAVASIQTSNPSVNAGNDVAQEQQQQQQQHNMNASDLPLSPVEVREPAIRLPQWKRKTWDPNQLPEGAAGDGYDDSDASSSSESESSSSEDSDAGSHSSSLRHRRRVSRQQQQQQHGRQSFISTSSVSTSLRERRSAQLRSPSPSSSITSSSILRSRAHRRSDSRSTSSSHYHLRSRSRSRSSSRRRRSVDDDDDMERRGRRSMISSSRRSSRSSHFYFDGHSTSDEEDELQNQQQSQTQTYHHHHHHHLSHDHDNNHHDAPFHHQQQHFYDEASLPQQAGYNVAAENHQLAYNSSQVDMGGSLRHN